MTDIRIKGTASIIISISLLFQTYLVSAKTTRDSAVVVIGKVTTGLNPKKDSIKVLTYGIELFGSKAYSIPISAEGDFKFKLNLTDKAEILRIRLKGENKVFMHRLIEPKDTLFIEVNASTSPAQATFRGKTALKYKCEDQLISQYNQFLSSRKGQFMKDFRIAYKQGDFQKTHRFYLNGYLKMIETLDSLKNEIGDIAYAYYKASYTRSYLGIWDIQIKNAFLDPDNTIIKPTIFENFKNYNYPAYYIDPEIASLNIDYLRYLIEKTQNELFFISQGTGYTLEAIYNQLKNKYQGVLRDRLLTFFLKGPYAMDGVINYNPEEFDHLLQQTFDLVKDPNLKSQLINQSKLKKGTKAYDFSLPDITGKLVHLRNFKGKVVLIDVWAEGCTGCALFFNKLKQEILPQLSQEKNFQLVSISVDKTKTGWLRGINSGLYTDKNKLNLNTAGKGLNDPFTKFYNIQSVPFIVLIDKMGNVFSSISISMGSTEITHLIQKALQE